MVIQIGLWCQACVGCILFVFSVYGDSILKSDISSDDVNYVKFGSGSNHPIASIDGFPDPETFFTKYVISSQPVKMTGAAKISPAFELWEDAYFLSLNVSADNLVLVETKKKENRKQKTLHMHFKDFVKSYNESEQYMVETVPGFLGKDVIVPSPLQCEPILESMMMDGIMWFSSGGTKSVVHTDAVENINCVFRGQKQFVLVNPHLYGDKVVMDHPEGAYSGVDVDRVDYTLYPGLRDVEYEVANLTAGDCLYIPFKWIHQVRSFNRNIAINFWFGTKPRQTVNFDLCNRSPDLDLTVDKVNFQGMGAIDNNIDALRDFLSGISEHNEVTFDVFLDAMLEDDAEFLNEIDAGRGYQNPLRQVFSRLDRNRNAVMEAEEVHQLTEKDWAFIQGYIEKFEDTVDFLMEKYGRDHPDEEEEGDDDEEETDDESHDEL